VHVQRIKQYEGMRRSGRAKFPRFGGHNLRLLGTPCHKWCERLTHVSEQRLCLGRQPAARCASQLGQAPIRLFNSRSGKGLVGLTRFVQTAQIGVYEPSGQPKSRQERMELRSPDVGLAAHKRTLQAFKAGYRLLTVGVGFLMRQYFD
jgi:hypothetical protein